MAQGNEKAVGPQSEESRVEAMSQELDSVIDGESGVTERNIARSIEQRGAETGDLVAMAIDRNLDTDKLQALIEMRNKQEDRENRRVFMEHFSAMQAEFESAHRTKQGYDYRYAPIEELQKQYGPIIARHGFSYRWREEAIETGKRITMTVAGWGHQEETSFDVPRIEGTKQMNLIQVVGAMSTYGRRYTFIAGFGVIIADEDDDGQAVSASEVDALLPELAKLEAATTMDELKTVYKQVFSHAESESQKMIVINAKNRRKEAINAG